MSEPDPADEDDLDAATDGDAAAFGRLIRRHQRRLYALLVRRLGSEADAEDVLQNASLLAWSRLHQFRRRSQFSTWLTRIALTQAATLTRKRARRPPSLSLTTFDGANRPVTDSRETPSDAVAQAEEAARRRSLIAAAIDSLPDDQRDVIVLKEFDNRSYDEIAEIIECPVGTVRSRLHRARLQLSQKLRPLMAEPPAGVPV